MRQPWIDQVKGACMVLVLLFHAQSIGDRYVASPDVVGVVNRFFSPYFITTFMFVSGMMLARGLAKPAGEFVTSRVREIAWPYVLWSFIYLLAAERFEVPKSFAAILLVPPTYLWYLWFLLAFYAIAWVTQRLRLPFWVPLVVGAALSFGPDTFRLSRFGFLLFCFVLGHLYAQRFGLGRPPVPARRLVVGGSTVVAVLFGVLSALRHDIEYNGLFLWVPVAGFVVAIAGFQALAALPPNPVGAVLDYVGRSSLIFYVVHFTVIWVVDRELSAAGLDDGTALYLAGLAAAVAASVLLVEVSRRYAFARLLVALPRRRPPVVARA